jgi:hypothetical protein
MDRNDPSYKGQRGYNRFLLAIYDPWVIGFMTRAVWKVPVLPAVERYRRLMGRRHLDVGPGTGYFLAKAAPPDGTDGNPATVADPTWTPLFSSPAPLTTPAFPDHPWGHGCVSGAMVETLKDFFGTDSVSFSVTSSLSGTTRAFDRFSRAIKEIVDARVWAGIHFRIADTQGHVIGRKVAHWLERQYFGPVT